MDLNENILQQALQYFIINRCSFSGATLSGGFSLESSTKRFTTTSIERISKLNLEKVLKEMAGKEYSFLKKRLSEILIEEITPVGKEITKLLNDKSHLKGILKKGAEKANIIAEENLRNVRDIVGLI